MTKEEFLQKIKEENAHIIDAVLDNIAWAERVNYTRFQLYFEKNIKRESMAFTIVFSLELRDQDNPNECIWGKVIQFSNDPMEEGEEPVYITLWRMWEDSKLLNTISSLQSAKDGNPELTR